jgi:ketosteroid isomerase-like protein
MQNDVMDKPEDVKKMDSGSRAIVKPVLITVSIVAGVIAVIFLAIAITGEEDMTDFLKKWEQIVESGDEKAYADICSEDFKQKFSDMYEESKKLVSEKEIDVAIDDSGIEKIKLDENHYAVKHIPISMNKDDVQTYHELYLEKQGWISPRWKIDRAGYDFSKETMTELKQVVEEKSADEVPELDETPRDTEFRIRQTLEVWRTAWEDKDVNKYVDCYADYASIIRVTVVEGKEEQTELTKDELREHMERLNKKYSKIQVQIWKPLKIEGDIATAKANFLQEYSAWDDPSGEPVYRDIGMKELQFVKHDLEWKITNENWTLYKDVPIYPKREL